MRSSMYLVRSGFFFRRSSNSGEAVEIVLASIIIVRFMRRASISCMLLQLMKDSIIRFAVGTVTTELSKFLTLTVLSVISTTLPSMLRPDMVIQSFIFTMSSEVSWTLATKPEIESLNTNINIAERPASPPNNESGF